jgi:hypothetical protein
VQGTESKIVWLINSVQTVSTSGDKVKVGWLFVR